MNFHPFSDYFSRSRSIFIIISSHDNAMPRQDFELNRLAIGRFVQELIDDITFDDLYNDSDDDFANVSSPHNISLKSSEIARGIKSEKYSFNRLNDGHVDGRSNLAPNANMLIYSGHDSTLVPLLCALGVYDGKMCVYNYWEALCSNATRCLRCGLIDAVVCDIFFRCH